MCFTVHTIILVDIHQIVKIRSFKQIKIPIQNPDFTNNGVSSSWAASFIEPWDFAEYHLLLFVNNTTIAHTHSHTTLNCLSIIGLCCVST